MVFFTGAFVALAAVHVASASLYITFPISGSTCAVSQPCQIKWRDSADSPSTSTLGETSVDLVAGEAANLQLVQTIGGISDPSQATAITFTPDASLSRNMQYAIRFTPKKNVSGVIFSTYFSITGGNSTATSLPAAAVGARTGSPPSSATSSNTSSSTSLPSKTLSMASSINSTTHNTTASDSAKSSGAPMLFSVPPFFAVFAALVAYLSC